jgi:hypothetical protein
MTHDTDTVHVRSVVDDVPAAARFYATYLGFVRLDGVGRATLHLLRSSPTDIVPRPGGKQILLEDPAGNPVELFEAARR